MHLNHGEGADFGQLIPSNVLEILRELAYMLGSKMMDLAGRKLQFVYSTVFVLGRGGGERILPPDA